MLLDVFIVSFKCFCYDCIDVLYYGGCNGVLFFFIIYVSDKFDWFVKCLLVVEWNYYLRFCWYKVWLVFCIGKIGFSFGIVDICLLNESCLFGEIIDDKEICNCRIEIVG